MDAQLALESRNGLPLQVTLSKNATLSSNLARMLEGLLMNLLGIVIYFISSSRAVGSNCGHIRILEFGEI